MVSLSVIIPVFNAQNYIRKTVETINASSVKPMEIILVNDGSVDESRNICAKLGTEYDNIVLIDKENGGIAEARNTGLNAAKGDYVCFVDQDDIVDEKMYESAFSRIEAASEPVDLVMVGTGRIIDGNRIPFEQFEDREYFGENSRDILFKAFMFRGYVNPARDTDLSISASVWKCIIRHEFLESNNIRFKRFISYDDDYVFMCSVLAHIKSAVTLSLTGYYWVINGNSESHRGKYIENYGEKTVNLANHIQTVMRECDFSEELCGLAYNQLLFEKTIDLIDNEYCSKNRVNGPDRKTAVKEYLKKTGFFKIDSGEIKPLPDYRRIKVLYTLYKLKNTLLLIAGIRFFRNAERNLHKRAKLMQKVSSKK